MSGPTFADLMCSTWRARWFLATADAALRTRGVEPPTAEQRAELQMVVDEVLHSCLACGRHPSTHAPAVPWADSCPMCGLGPELDPDVCQECGEDRPPLISGRCAECRSEASAP